MSTLNFELNLEMELYDTDPVATGFEHILKADVHPLAHQNNSE